MIPILLQMVLFLVHDGNIDPVLCSVGCGTHICVGESQADVGNFSIAMVPLFLVCVLLRQDLSLNLELRD